jgi:hypothetical protein
LVQINTSKELNGIISNIQRYSIHDEPGIRTTVFLKGCPPGYVMYSLYPSPEEYIEKLREIAA